MTASPSFASRTPLGRCPRCENTALTILFLATDRLYRTTSREFQIVECAGCSLLRLEPQPSAQELGQFYPENYWWAPDGSAVGRLEGLYRRLVLRDHLRFVARGVREGRVLDVGCGGGSFLA